MNSNIVNKIPPKSKNNNLRCKGIFFLLAAIVFVLQGLFFLNNMTTWILLTVIEFIYVFAFPEKISHQPTQISWINKISRLLVQFALLLLIGFIVVFVWVLLWKTTGMPVSFLAAITCALTGLILVIWSFMSVFGNYPIR
jgi:hypothetical protein